ncbi:VOC family protein [Streptomyces stramineus]
MKPPAISPCLGVSDTQAAVDFYEKLGFTALPAGNDPDDDLRILLFEGEFALMVYRDEHLRGWLPVLKDTPVGAFGMFYLAVDDFDSYVERIRPWSPSRRTSWSTRARSSSTSPTPTATSSPSPRSRPGDRRGAEQQHHRRGRGEVRGVLGPRRKGARRLLRRRPGLEGHPDVR